jgi:hypothetical protein
MNREDKILTTLLSAVAVLGPLAIGFGLHWAIWQSALLILLLLVVVILIARKIAFRRDQQRLRDSVEPVTSPEPREQPARPAPTLPTYPTSPISDMSLASAQPDYRFRFGATVHWRPTSAVLGPPHANLSALATNAIIGRAYEITRLEQPGDYELVEHKLNAELGRILTERTGQVETWAVQVTLTLPPVDIERLHKLSEVRKNEQVWEHERNHERNRRAYLTEDVLKTPGSAVVWWLARDFSQVRETVALIGTLAQLSAAANNAEVPELFRPLLDTPVSGRADGALNGTSITQAVPAGFDSLMLLPPANLPEARNGSADGTAWRAPRPAEQSDRG